MKELKEELNYGKKGITLIALVITIIVLLILAGVTIATLTGDNGILTRATEAKNKTEQSEEIEKIKMAVLEAQIGKNGYQELNQNNLQESLNNQFNGRDVVVSNNGDGTFTVSCLDTLKDYTISGNEVEEGIDWNEVMANAVAPESQDEERNEGIIGIGTDGKPVDMDQWKYTKLDDETYGLNDEVSLNTTASANASKGYIGNFTEEGKIIGTVPKYISQDNGKTFEPVTSMKWTFYDCQELVIMPIIPNTVTSLDYAFRKCSNLEEIRAIPNSVTSLVSTFNSCTSLIFAPVMIPYGVTNLASTFEGCTSLISVPSVIPNSVTNMQTTFYKCASLEKGPTVIPNSVTNFYDTFRGCTKLSGNMEINANIKGITLSNGKLDYESCFKNATTSVGSLLTLKCSENVYNLFYNESSDNKINSIVCSTESNIVIEKNS